MPMCPLTSARRSTPSSTAQNVALVVSLFETLRRVGAPGSRLTVNFGLGVEAAEGINPTAFAITAS
jgi:hypothetical protein